MGTTPMFSPDGILGDIPNAKVQDAVKSGFQLGHEMSAPNGTEGVIPHDKVHDAIKAGFSPYVPTEAQQAAKPTVASQPDIGMKQSLPPRLVRAGTSSLPGLGGMAGGVIASPGVVTTAAGVGLGAGAGVEAKQLINRAIFGKDEPATTSVAGLKEMGTEMAVQGGTTLAMGALANAPSYVDQLKAARTAKIQKLIGVTPQRVEELSQVQGKVADIHDIAVKAEQSAHAQASAAFPDIKTPVALPANIEDVDSAMGVKSVPFRDAQELYSQLSLDARGVHLARLRGMATGFDEAEILRQKGIVDSAMQAAAHADDVATGASSADGKLAQLFDAREGFMKYMNDFHAKGSPIEPLLEMKPDETYKIANHFLSPDKGARAIEVLQKYGNDTTPIEDFLSKGSTPIKIDVNEAAKLRKMGIQGYADLRLQESIDQATYNRLPSSAQARLPAESMKQYTKLLPYVPGSPSIPTRFLTKKLLTSDAAQEAVKLRTLAGNP